MFILVVFGVLCGILASILGAGSSMMMTPLLIYVFPLVTGDYFSIQTITSATLALTFFSTATASMRYHAAKLIPYRYALILAVSGSAGSFVSAAYISKQVNHLFILILFGAIAVLSLVFNLVPIKKKGEQGPKKIFFVMGIVIIFFLGITTGIIGIGGMVLFMPYMVYVLCFSVRKTIISSTFAGAMIALFGIIGKSLIGMMDWKVSLVVAVGGMIGGFFGPTFSKFFSERILGYGLNVILFMIIFTVLIDIYKNI
ncbi:sulfite exporter TauE/SafE family protein [Peribacillus saganii]|uniref:Probable membrane transporter protein n=1 Tax=Peribacillus saganii TaxID=2303992 RepID=A0A372LQ05_9BACI|nr:sulfite exporter TauE/SafE family protein [Peribacillus saganii]RFU70278.1 sulfite exporter TauE/SafE family protein [Peribacillus saganii]